MTEAWVRAIQIAQMKENDLKILMEEKPLEIYVRDGLLKKIGTNGERIVLSIAVSIKLNNHLPLKCLIHLCTFLAIEEIARKVHKWMRHFSGK